MCHARVAVLAMMIRMSMLLSRKDLIKRIGLAYSEDSRYDDVKRTASNINER
jgi:hypothetical protein